MHERAVTLNVVTLNVAACERMQRAIDAASGAVAGFALLAGARAFTFIALVAWREPVLGGAGLVLLAAIGWARWCWRRNVSSRGLLTRSLRLTKVLREAVCDCQFELQQDLGDRKTMQTSNDVGPIGTGSTNEAPSASGSHNGNKATFKDLLDQLVDYTKGTTGERLQKMILAKLGVTEEDLKKMSPEDREKIMQKVREMLKQEMEAQKQLEEMQKDRKIRVSV